MTIGEFVEQKIQEHYLNTIVKDHSDDYTRVTFNNITNYSNAIEFSKFVAEAKLVSIRGNVDGSITCWF